MKGLHWYIKVLHLAAIRRNRNRLSGDKLRAIRHYCTKKVLKNEEAYLEIRTVIFLLLLGRLYIGLGAAAILLSAVVITLPIILYYLLPESRELIKNCLPFYNSNKSNFTKLRGMIIALYKYDIFMTKGITFTVYFFVGLISAYAGEARFDYVMKNNQVCVKNQGYDGKLVYIGTTSNGAIFFDEENTFRYLSHDGTVSIREHPDSVKAHQLSRDKQNLIFPVYFYHYLKRLFQNEVDSREKKQGKNCW